MDVICPCARIHSIHEGNASALQARLISPGANNPWTSDAEAILRERGVLLIPDFAANTGGILGTFMAYTCFSHEEIASYVQQQFELSTCWMLEQSRRRGLAVRAIAEELIAYRGRHSTSGERHGLGSIMFAAGIALHRRGFVPGAFVRRYTRRFLSRRLRLDSAD